MRLLLLEDDPLLGQGIVDAFTRQGDCIDWLTEAKQALSALRTTPFELLILDLGLPDSDGLELLKEIRRQGIELPVLILTARDQISDRVKGLDAGGDDYLIKPFDLDELNARIRALLRRQGGHRAPQLTVQGISLDPASREVYLDGKQIELSRREFALLHEFMQNPGRVLTREQLIEKLYNWQERLESNAIEVHIHHLRKKLGNQLIHTIRGVGYRIDKSS